MLHLDAEDLHLLPEAARRLLWGPGRLERLARQGRVPWVRREGGMAFPRAWVEAEAGQAPVDAGSVGAYWLERLAPAAPDARRAARDRGDLPAADLLDAGEAARRLLVDPVRLDALARRGVLPALRVDGETRYDEVLVDLVAREDPDAEAGQAAEARRTEVAAWSRFEYVTGLGEGSAAPPAPSRAAPREALAAAPRAWRMPEDVAAIPLEEPSAPPDAASAPAAAGEGEEEGFEPEEGPSRLIRTEGFETVDED